MEHVATMNMSHELVTDMGGEPSSWSPGSQECSMAPGPPRNHGSPSLGGQGSEQAGLEVFGELGGSGVDT